MSPLRTPPAPLPPAGSHPGTAPHGWDGSSAAAAFPLGGISTGTVSVGARGELRDWELRNLPAKGRYLPFTFFAIHVEGPEGETVNRVLESRFAPPYFRGGEGLPAPAAAGLPRFRESRMRGEYPLVAIELRDPRVPVAVTLEAFTPFVPLDADDSGIPGAVLRYSVVNPADVPRTVTIAGSMSHPVVDRGATVEWHDDGTIRGLCFGARGDVPASASGSAALATTDVSTTAKPRWLTGTWNDGVQSFWNDFRDDGLLEPETRRTLDEFHPSIMDTSERPVTDDDYLDRAVVGSLGIVHVLAPGEKRDFEFLLSWHVPFRPAGWNGHIMPPEWRTEELMRNHYAVRYPDAWAAARDLADRLPQLEAATRSFHDALWNSTLDPAVVDAAASTLSTLRSTTCFRLEDGTFAAWEGSFDHSGSCEGTCTHVWNYAQSVAWLFPDLERSARRVELLLETDDDGRMQFRTNRVFGGPSWGALPAADGQFGVLIRLWREVRFSGDLDFARDCWPAAVRALEYGLRHWDADGDGVLDQTAHNTYDIEFVGSEPLLTGLQLAALRAMAELADRLDEPDRATAWRDRAARGAARMDALLWKDGCYRQVTDDVDAVRYQYGDGVLSDQLFGQTLAHLTGLGHIVDPDHARDAIRTVFTRNYRHDLSDHESTQRTYALNDEGGLLLCSWPDGGRPRVPFIYSDEVWTGIEYQVATDLAYEGLVDDALTLVRTTRARHDGTARNPWNEQECGHHYARSLAAWGVLLALTGVQYDATRATLEIDPKTSGPMRTIVTTGSGWGVATIDGDSIELDWRGGTLHLDSLRIRGSELLTPGETLHLTAGERMRRG